MALIVLLLLNATTTQVFNADGLRADPRNSARAARRVLPPARPDLRRRAAAGLFGVHRRPLSIPSRLPQSPLSTHRLRASTRCGTPAPGWNAPRTASSTDPTSGSSAAGWPTSSPAAIRAAAMSTPRSCRGSSRPAGTPCSRAATTDPARARWWPIEPSTGKILALVSSPSYDPNLLATHDVAQQSAAWGQLGDNPDSPLTNRAISERYPPGSTFKVITTAAALTGRNHRGRAAHRIAVDRVAGQHRHAGELRRVALWFRTDGVTADGVRPVLQHRVRPARVACRHRCAEERRAVVRPRRPARPDPAAGRRIDRRARPRRRGTRACRASGKRMSR